MDGVEVVLIIKMRIFLIIKVMIQMNNLFVLIRIPIKAQDLCLKYYKLVNHVHLLKPLGIHQAVIHQ